MIEAEVRNHIIASTDLAPYMATYNGQMAVFNQEAPDDTKPGWGTKSQYGRIVFYIDMQDDPERNISGTMGMDIYCESGKQVPEEIEPILRTLVDGYFFSTADVTIATRWNTTKYFTDPTKKIIGATLMFTLMAFPKQETTEPDPIALINKWTANELPSIVGATQIRVIGKDALPPAWKPDDTTPAIYWRLGRTQKCNWIPDTYHCSWQTASVWGHVMAQNRDTEIKIARLIQNTLAIKKRLIFEDMSPLMVDRNIQITSSNDPIRTGQISIDGTYGILNIPLAKPKINKISVK